MKQSELINTDTDIKHELERRDIIRVRMKVEKYKKTKMKVCDFKLKYLTREMLHSKLNTKNMMKVTTFFGRLGDRYNKINWNTLGNKESISKIQISILQTLTLMLHLNS